MIYLASPYSHIDPEIELVRYRQITNIAGRLIDKGVVLFAPITQSVAVVKYSRVNSRGFDYWEKFDKEFVSLSDEVWVVVMPGWRESVGVQEEIRYAESLGKPVRYLCPKSLTFLDEEQLCEF
jgi:hypothetical protein